MKLLLALLVSLASVNASAKTSAPPADVMSSTSSAAAARTTTYGLHLFFNEKEFIDVLTLTRSPDGKLTGHMFVPDDFEGAIENVQISGNQITFDLFVPKNSARPQDLVFHYRGVFFDKSQNQLVGYVTIKGAPSFVASFVAFARANP